jgi:O-methyltransferase
MKRLAKKFVRWSVRIKVFSLPWRIFESIVIYALHSKKKVVISYADPERGKVIDLIDKIKQGTGMLIDDNEACQIFMAVKRTEKIKGEIAEVGVYKGGSARVICEAKGDRSFHLFDTFDGLPKVSKVDSPWFFKGQYAACLNDVKSCLEIYKNVHFYKGVFPATSGPIEDKTFCFVHLDVDTYESTLDCLSFFYPRMGQGGVLISHDYTSAAGVRKAFDEFFNEKREPIIELPGSQCLIVKL